MWGLHGISSATPRVSGPDLYEVIPDYGSFKRKLSQRRDEGPWRTILRMSPGMFRRRDPRLRLEQSLGAFPVGNGDISPLYVLFGLSNPGSAPVVVERVYVRAGRDTILELTGDLGGDEGGPPREVPSGATATLWLRAKELSARLRDAGHAGNPKLRLLVVDSGGGEHGTAFRLRVDEYLRLKDE